MNSKSAVEGNVTRCSRCDIHGPIMALKLLNLQIIIEKQLTRQTPLLTILRYGHRLRGKAPGVAKTLEERLNGELLVVYI